MSPVLHLYLKLTLQLQQLRLHDGSVCFHYDFKYHYDLISCWTTTITITITVPCASTTTATTITTMISTTTSILHFHNYFTLGDWALTCLCFLLSGGFQFMTYHSVTVNIDQCLLVHVCSVLHRLLLKLSLRAFNFSDFDLEDAANMSLHAMWSMLSALVMPSHCFDWRLLCIRCALSCSVFGMSYNCSACARRSMRGVAHVDLLLSIWRAFRAVGHRVLSSQLSAHTIVTFLLYFSSRVAALLVFIASQECVCSGMINCVRRSKVFNENCVCVFGMISDMRMCWGLCLFSVTCVVIQINMFELIESWSEASLVRL